MKRRDFMKLGSAAFAFGGIVKGTVSAAEPSASSTSMSDSARKLNSWKSEIAPTTQRLSQVTRELAMRARSGEHGRATVETDYAVNDAQMAGFADTPNMRYAVACMMTAERAPVRLIEGEKLAGYATIRNAAWHTTPGLPGVSSVSHTTLGFEQVLKIGYRGLRERIDERLSRGDMDASGRDLLQSMRMCLEAAGVWHQRYLDAIEMKMQIAADPNISEAWRKVWVGLKNVPENPPQNFHEAVQSLWFTWDFQRLMGTWSGLGRVDKMLWPYLERDLQSGAITLDEARELLANFWLKGCEWIGLHQGPGSGDAQVYQNVVLSGCDENGRDITNPVTYLILDVVEELHISDFPIAVRISRHTPNELLRKIAQVQRHGGGIVAVYNEEVVIEGLVNAGIPLNEARGFANDGCWEAIIPGKTTFSYAPFDILGLLHETLTLNAPVGAETPNFADFDSLYTAFLKRLEVHLDGHKQGAAGWAKTDGAFPTPLVSLLVEDCIERGRSYFDRGARYTILAPHAGGMANLAASLQVIQKIVFEDQYVSLPEFINTLRADWSGAESFRRLIGTRFTFYGNDDDIADTMMQRVFNDYTALAAQRRESEGVLTPAGISTFGREIEWSAEYGGRRAASPDGHKRGAVLATNFSPSPGTDKSGPTAAIHSYCKLDFTKTPNGATLEIKLHPSSVKGEDGIEAMVAMLKSFVSLGGWFMHTDVVDSAMLLDAQLHPEKYPYLPVRISGWSARFATLSRAWQDMVINRTQQYI